MQSHLLLLVISDVLVRRQAKGPRKNNFVELAPRFASDLVAPIEQNRRNSSDYFEASAIEKRPKMA